MMQYGTFRDYSDSLIYIESDQHGHPKFYMTCRCSWMVKKKIDACRLQGGECLNGDQGRRVLMTGQPPTESMKVHVDDALPERLRGQSEPDTTHNTSTNMS